MKKFGVKLKWVLVQGGTANQAADYEAAVKGNPDGLFFEEDPVDCVASATALATFGFHGKQIFVGCPYTPAVFRAGG